MVILIFVTAILVSIILERQERRHQFELQLEYRRLEKSVPAIKPKLTLTHSYLNIVIGLAVAGLGIVIIYSVIYSLIKAGEAYRMHQFHISEPLDLGSVILATGIALVIMGAKSVSLNRKYSAAITTEELHSNVKITQTRD